MMRPYTFLKTSLQTVHRPTPIEAFLIINLLQLRFHE